jgi:hypothetical protein
MARRGREKLIQVPQQAAPVSHGERLRATLTAIRSPQQEKQIAICRKAIPVSAVEFPQPPLLQVAPHGVAIATGHKESGPRPLRWCQVDGDVPPAATATVLQQFADPVGVLEDPAPGEPLIEQG